MEICRIMAISLGRTQGCMLGTVNPQGNPATPLQSARNAQHIVGTAFSADPMGLCSLVFPILHQTSLLEIRRICLYVSNFQRDAKTHERSNASTPLAGPSRTR